MSRATVLTALPTFDPEGDEFLTVIETPKGSRNKYAYNPKLCAFELKKLLPRGMSFPYDFGFVPSTRALMVTRWTCCCCSTSQRPWAA